jgi:hypothetical protein
MAVTHKKKPEANFPVSGLPLSGAVLLANWPTDQRIN